MLHVDFVEDGVTLELMNRWFADQQTVPLFDNTDAEAAWGDRTW